MLEKEKNKTKEMITGRRFNRFGTIMDISNELRASVKYHGDEDILMSSDINTKNIKKDLLLFKDEILKDIKRQQIKLFEKAEDNEKYTIEKIEEFNIKIQKFSENINNLSNMIITDKTIREKVESLIEFKNKNQELMTTTGVKIDNLDKDLYNNIYRIDSILKETVIYPRIIGIICKFKTFHEFMDYVLNECTHNINFREKTVVDLNNLRSNNDKIVNNFNIKLEKTKKTLTSYIDASIKKIENKINSLNDVFNDKINNYRIENMTYSENMKKASESLLKQVNNVIQAKNDIFNKFDEKINIINKEHTRMIKYFTGYKNEFNEMRRMFKEMLEAINNKDFSGLNRKANRLARRQTMINNDFKKFENNLNNINNVVHPISMNDMFNNENKNYNQLSSNNGLSLNNRLSLNNNNVFSEKERSTPYKLFVKEFKRINTESRRMSKIFGKVYPSTETKIKSDEIKLDKKKKEHNKKIKYLNEIYLSYKNKDFMVFERRKMNKNNSICVPNQKFRIDLLKKVAFKKEKIETKNKINNNNKDIKSRNTNLESIYETSYSKSENSLFSKDSNNSKEEKKNFIKTKYKVDTVIKEMKETNTSKNLNDKVNISQFKIKIDQKDFQEDQNTKFLNQINIQNNFYGNDNNNIDINLEQVSDGDKIDKNDRKNNKIDDKNTTRNNELKKIYLTLDGFNQIEIDPNSRQINKTEKNIVNNVKSVINNKIGKTLSGFPKIVTNNGEKIIYSSRPVYKKRKFGSYINPNILALNYSINALYENNNSDKMSKIRQNIIETNPDYLFKNKQLLSKIKNINDNKSEKHKKVSFNGYRSTNIQNYLDEDNKY